MSNSLYAYLAGLFDGEGHITITRSKPAVGTMRKHKCVDGTTSLRPARCEAWQYCFNIGVTTTDERLLKWLMDRIGGSYYKDKRHQKINWKPAYRWRLLGRANQERILLAILPHLVIKKEQANLALSFIRMGDVEDPKAREFFFDMFQNLNRRGASPETNTPNTSEDVKIESVLIGDNESVVTVM